MTRKEKETLLKDLFNSKAGAERIIRESNPKALVFNKDGFLEIVSDPNKKSSLKLVGAFYEVMGNLKFKSYDKRLDQIEVSGMEIPLFI